MREVGDALVGRASELRELAAAWQRAASGRGGVTLLSGEPGIGKTTLAAAAADYAQRCGALALWGACWDGGGAPAFWPWIQVVRGLARRRDPETLREELGAGAPHVARVVEDLRDTLPDLPAPPQLDPDQARFQFFDGVSSMLVAAGRSTPLLLVMDDLHAADLASLALLEFLAPALRDAPILVVGAYREGAVRRDPERAALLGSIVRGGHRLPLRGLGPAELRELARRRGETVSDDMVRALHRRSGGNPFFADELLRVMRNQDGGPPGRPTELPLPDGVREAIAQRLEPLGPGTVALLEIASVLGLAFRLVNLAALAGADREAVLAQLDHALQAGLLRPVTGAPAEYAFTHALVRETLYEGIALARRRDLHARAGLLLEALHSRAGGTSVNELAHHFLAAASREHADRAVRYGMQAGNAAVARFAYGDAAAAYEGALQALELAGGDDDRRFLLAHLLGEAQVRAGHPQARASLALAADAARRAGNPRRFARAALFGGAAWGPVPGQVDREHVALLEEAIAWLDAAGERRFAGSPPPAPAEGLRALCRARLALALVWSGPDTARRQQLAGEAVALARTFAADTRVADQLGRGTLAQVLCQACVVTWTPDTVDAVLGTLDEVLGLCRDLADSEVEVRARGIRVSLLLEKGQVAAASLEMEMCARLAHKLGQPRAAFYAPLHRSVQATLAGRLAEAQTEALRAMDRAARVPGAVGTMLAGSQLWAVRWQQGRLAEAVTPALRFVQAAPELPVWRAALARAHAGAGRTDLAAAELAAVAPDGWETIRFDNVWVVTVALAGETAALIGDGDTAARARELLAPYAGRNAMCPEAACLGPVDRFLGVCAAAAGDRDGALGHLRAAGELARRMGSQPFLIASQVEEAAVLASGGTRADLRRARAILDGVAPLAGELGLGIAERIDALRGRLHSCGPAPGPRGALLAREGDVWTVKLDGDEMHLRHAKGLVYLAELLAAPEVERHALDLVTGPPGGGSIAGPAAGDDPALRAGGNGDAGPRLDAQAKQEYRERITALRDDVDGARAFKDLERAARATRELAFLEDELAGAVGLGGRDRREVSDAERARVNVTRALRSAIARIADHHPELGAHLETSVRTGTFCSYRPDPAAGIVWHVVARS